MSSIARVTETAREHLAREYDARGPEVCTLEVVDHLNLHDPEFLDIAMKCAVDTDNPDKAMTGFSMFYRLVAGHPPSGFGVRTLTLLPHVSAETRDRLVAEIDAKGVEPFTREAIAELDDSTPELLQMAHGFASGFADYLLVMQGFALLYRALTVQATAEPGPPH